MIVKMKFLSVSGPKADIDRVCDVYLSKYEMQLENAVTELKTADNLLPFVEMNPYKEPLAKVEQFVKFLPTGEYHADLSIEKEDILKLVRDINHDYLELMERKELLKRKRDELKERADVLEPFRSLDVDIQKVMKYQYMQVRFGRIGIDYYRKLERYLFEDLNAVFLEGIRSDSHVYGCYFVANADVSKVDSVFGSLHFERISLAGEYVGTPAAAYESIMQEIEDTKSEIGRIRQEIQTLMKSHGAQLLGARKRLENMCDNFDVRKRAARMNDDQSES